MFLLVVIIVVFILSVFI